VQAAEPRESKNSSLIVEANSFDASVPSRRAGGRAAREQEFEFDRGSQFFRCFGAFPQCRRQSREKLELKQLGAIYSQLRSLSAGPAAEPRESDYRSNLHSFGAFQAYTWTRRRGKARPPKQVARCRMSTLEACGPGKARCPLV